MLAGNKFIISVALNGGMQQDRDGAVIPGVSEDLGDTFGDIHALLALVLIALIVLHAAAGLKHQFFDRLPAAGRMPPFQPADGRPVVVGQGGGAEPTER